MDTMTQTFKVKVAGDSSQRMRNIRDNFAKKGINFICEGGKGSFAGMGLVAKYVREEDELVVTLYSVPPFCTFDSIEEAIKGSLENLPEEQN